MNIYADVTANPQPHDVNKGEKEKTIILPNISQLVVILYRVNKRVPILVSEGELVDLAMPMHV